MLTWSAPHSVNPVLSLSKGLAKEMSEHLQPNRHVDRNFERRLSYRMPALNDTPSSKAFPVPEIIPIFPLPNVVLFPDTYLPLHIFEPRYREMVADAGREGACIGMALFKQGWESRYYDNPPIFSLGCVGRMTHIERLHDGRSNLILQGLYRYTIEEEFFDASYRKAKITLEPSEPFQTIAQGPVLPVLSKAEGSGVEGSGAEGSVRSTLTALAIRYLQSRKADKLCELVTDDALTDRVLVNGLSSCLDFTPLEKQFLLEAESLHQQTRRLIDLLKFKLDDETQLSGWE